MTQTSPSRRESFNYLSSPIRTHSFDEEPSLEPYTPQAVKTNRRNSDTFVAVTMLGTALAMLLLTTIPVVATIPDFSVWFSGDALWRLFDPLITLPLNLSIVMQAEVFHTGGKHRFFGAWSERSFALIIWAIGAGIYVQGHGIHLAAAMFKHPIQQFNLDNLDLVAQYPILNEMYLNMEDLWEHKIAHYMYAFGGMWMSWVQLFLYRNQVHGPLSLFTKIIWIIGTILYGVLLAGVAIEFPDGLYVGLVYTIVIGTICILIITLKANGLRRGGILTMGQRMVIQYYLGACVIGLVVVIAWIAKYGFQNRKAAGIA
ncbi:hypothetical protein INT43_000952 [Umbelopsis isabellina]|uniref:Uncharacterized protein n=1 Tax=Mortierella isabellina TaxID=91625 RepID=A0A8H7Q252_MORIS|nr:hypothetical protein INT43_000952 [Umbelopsis isabellina]